MSTYHEIDSISNHRNFFNLRAPSPRSPAPWFTTILQVQNVPHFVPRQRMHPPMSISTPSFERTCVTPRNLQAHVVIILCVNAWPGLMSTTRPGEVLPCHRDTVAKRVLLFPLLKTFTGALTVQRCKGDCCQPMISKAGWAAP